MWRRRNIYHRMLNLDSCGPVARAARHPSPCANMEEQFSSAVYPVNEQEIHMSFIPGRDTEQPLLLPESLSEETFLLGSPQPWKLHLLSHPCADAQNTFLSSGTKYQFDI